MARQSRRSRTLATAAAVMTFMLAGTLRSAAPDRLAEKAEDGQQLLAKGEFDQAREVFGGGLREAIAAGDTQWQAKFFFFQALADQQQARMMAGGPEAERLLKQADALYGRANRLKQDWGPALNNRAQVLINQAKFEEVPALLQRAIGLEDRFQTFYAENYADYLAQQHQTRDAIRFYRLVRDAQPEREEVHDKLMEQYKRLGEAPAVLDYLWRLVRRGRFNEARDAALEMLEQDWSRRAAVPDEDRRRGALPVPEELITLVVAALAHARQAPETVLGSATAERLEAIARTRGDLAPAVEQLVACYRGEALNPRDAAENYSWWARRFNRERDPPRGRWPKDAMAGLFLSLGDWWRTREDSERAEAYYRLAADLNPDDPDPDAFRKLADLYVVQNQTEKLGQLIQNYEDALLQAKGDAYSTANLDRIFRFHRALGIIYASLDRWDQGGPVANATFQLRRAMAVAKQHNERTRQVDAANAEPLTLEPQLVTILAQHYADQENPRQAYVARIEAAEMYLSARDAATAVKVCRDLPLNLPEGLSAHERQRAAVLKHEIDTTLQDNAPPDAVRAIEPRLRSEGTGQAAVRFPPGMGRSGSALTPQQAERIGNAVSQLVQQQTADLDRHPGRAAPFKLLPRQAPRELMQVELDGRQGKAVIDQGRQQLEIPFTVEGVQVPNDRSVRYVRP